MPPFQHYNHSPANTIIGGASKREEVRAFVTLYGNDIKGYPAHEKPVLDAASSAGVPPRQYLVDRILVCLLFRERENALKSA